jgi:hypothetical protein
MNGLIERLFDGFEVGGVEIPVSFLRYEGHGEPYVTYMQEDADRSLSGDDGYIGYVAFYDFDVYSKGNYFPIIKELKRVLTENGFVWQPSRSGGDFYETDTGYYHRTVSFAIPREV